MADKKISEMTAMTEADVAVTSDYLPIVDVSQTTPADRNRRITVEELAKAVVQDASAFVPSGSGLSATTVQGAIEEVVTDYVAADAVVNAVIDNHIADTAAAHAASAISFTPTGTVAATDVQAAIAEVALEAAGNPASIIDAKGDLIAGSAPDTPAKVTVGANGAVLTADSTATAGVSWQVTGFTTGDVKLTLKTAADTGWVLMNDGTIGNAASGGTTRANADTEALFTLLWNNTADAQCAVSTGRGSSAAADYAANKTIALPKALGRSLAASGSGSGLTARALGSALGSENAIVVDHNHTGTTGGQSADHTHQYTRQTTPDSYSGGPGSQFINPAAGTTGGTSNDHTHSFTTNNTGSSGTGANMQPTLFLNVMVKL